MKLVIAEKPSVAMSLPKVIGATKRQDGYRATVFLFLAVPLVLGSAISFVIMLCYIPIIIKRIRNEEQVLTKDLNGYETYKKKVKYRLIPFIW